MYSGVVYLYISPEDKVYVGVTINERQRRSCWFRAGDYAGFRIAAARRKYPPELWEYRVLSRVSLDYLVSYKEVWFFVLPRVLHDVSPAMSGVFVCAIIYP